MFQQVRNTLGKTCQKLWLTLLQKQKMFFFRTDEQKKKQKLLSKLDILDNNNHEHLYAGIEEHCVQLVEYSCSNM